MPVRPITCREVGLAYADVLSALHGQCFEQGWRPDTMRELLVQPGTIALIGTDGQIGTDSGDAPVALAMGRVVLGEAEVLTIGVLPDHRQAGFGRQILAALLLALMRLEARVVFLEVAVGNSAARALYVASGFAEVGRRKGYYRHADGRVEDALVMRRDFVA